MDLYALKGGSKFVAKYISEGKLDAGIHKWIQMEYLSYEYGWTPDQIRKMKSKDIAMYSVISGFRNKESNNKGGLPKKFAKKLR